MAFRGINATINLDDSVSQSIFELDEPSTSTTVPKKKFPKSRKSANTRKVEQRSKRIIKNKPSGFTPKSKKRKLNNFLEKENKLGDSIIVVEDSDQSNLGLETPTKSNNDVIIIDDLSITDEHFQNILLHKETAMKKTDPIIVVDANDETPATSTKDCQVVWASSPPKSTASLLVNPLVDKKKAEGVLKQDKIYIDKSPDLNNLKILTKSNNKKTKLKKKVISSKTKTTVKKTPAKASSVPVNKKTNLLMCNSKTDKPKPRKGSLREIVIDGMNIGMASTAQKTFSEKGIELVIKYFKKRGHKVLVFLPQHRRSRAFPLLEQWYSDGIVCFTPSRKLGDKKFTSYDDRYILEYATERDGIVVSQDQFRDLYKEKPAYRDTIENRLLVPTFVGDYVMFPQDPLGRNGPTLDDFLKH